MSEREQKGRWVVGMHNVHVHLHVYRKKERRWEKRKGRKGLKGM